MRSVVSTPDLGSSPSGWQPPRVAPWDELPSPTTQASGATLLATLPQITGPRHSAHSLQHLSVSALSADCLADDSLEQLEYLPHEILLDCLEPRATATASSRTNIWQNTGADCTLVAPVTGAARAPTAGRQPHSAPPKLVLPNACGMDSADDSAGELESSEGHCPLHSRAQHPEGCEADTGARGRLAARHRYRRRPKVVAVAVPFAKVHADTTLPQVMALRNVTKRHPPILTGMPAARSRSGTHLYLTQRHPVACWVDIVFTLQASLLGWFGNTSMYWPTCSVHTSA